MNEKARSLVRAAARVPRSRAFLRWEIPLLSWNLDALAMLHQTDKAAHLHNYTAYYKRHLSSRRRSVAKVLEIGIGGFEGPRSGGASLRMWRDWFPRATVYGLDIEEKIVEGDRIVTIIGDQSDAASLASIGDECGPFDLIIDDGSHYNEHVRISFAALFQSLKPGGYYIVEDIVTAYYDEMGGGVPGSPGTTMALIKDLCDAVQRGEIRHDRVVPLPDYLVASVTVYPNLVFIEKAGHVREGFKV